MSLIRGRGNKATEIALAKLFRRNQITGWRRQRQLRAGKLRVERRKRSTSPRPSPQRGEGVRVRPDFVFPKLKLALFVDGCFWHDCPKHGTQPRGNRLFWKKKFSRNIARDRLVNRVLRRAKWRVLRIWEHELAKIKKTSTPHPGPHPVRGGEGEARLLRRIQRALI